MLESQEASSPKGMKNRRLKNFHKIIGGCAIQASIFAAKT